MMSGGRSCARCEFRNPDPRPEYEGAGYCRRFPPTINQWTHPNYDGPQYEQHWPWVRGDEWCGEFKDNDH